MKDLLEIFTLFRNQEAVEEECTSWWRRNGASNKKSGGNKKSRGGKYMSRKARSEVPELPPIFGAVAELPPSLGSAGMGSEDYVEEGEGQC